jgi:transcriptional regulator with PAS, ATPase and Fis domain
LQAAVAEGSFRSDLFYRLNVVPVELPPLRERKADIPTLVEYFIDRYARKAGKKIRTIDRRSLERLQSYPWPGNIRELQNIIERSVILSETDQFSIDGRWLSGDGSTPALGETALPKRSGAQEKERIKAALTESNGKVSGPDGAAELLGIPPSTLESKIRALKINKFAFKKS